MTFAHCKDTTIKRYRKTFLQKFLLSKHLLRVFIFL